MRKQFIFGLAVIMFLLTYGAIRFPTALESPIGLFADLAIVFLYGLLIWFWFPVVEERNFQLFKMAVIGGLLIGSIFLGEMLLEYIILPGNNSQMGLIEYGLVLLIFFTLASWAVYQTGRFRDGLFATIISALIGSMIWLIAVLAIYYLFHGTARQSLVFLAEGNLEDFTRSGMTDLNAFIMQDFWGAGFFHSTLLPFLSIIIGSIGSLLGILLVRIRKHNRNKNK